MDVKIEALNKKITLEESGNELVFNIDEDKRIDDIDYGGCMSTFMSGGLEEYLEMNDMDFDICINILREARKQYDQV